MAPEIRLIERDSTTCSTPSSSPQASASSSSRFSTSSPATECEAAMLIDYVLGAIVTVVIMIYLVYALIKPERF